jgi:hypothetical protein
MACAIACCSHRVARRINPSSDRRQVKIQWQARLIRQAALGKLMVSDDKKIKTGPTPKTEAPPEKKTEAPPENKGTSKERSKAEGGETTSASPSGYSRGEGQKPVSKAYKDNWNAIFAKKKKR